VIGEVGHLGFWQRLVGRNASCLFVLQDLSVKLIAAGGFEAESISVLQRFLAFKSDLIA